MNMEQRYEWVDFAKGICILAVVCLYVSNTATHYFGNAGLISYFVDFSKPFRMPDFFFLSGLFLSKSINKPLKYYLDRKVFHYLYFFILWTFISWSLLIATGVLNESLFGLIKSFISLSIIWPYHQLWFILMLALYFLAIRLTRKIPVWIMFPVLCALHIFNNQIHVSLSVVTDFSERLIFFYAGYVFAPFVFLMADKVIAHWKVTVLAIITWLLINGFLVFEGYSKNSIITLLLGFAGCFAVIAISVFLMQYKKYFFWLSYIGAHSIAIYLPFDWILTGISFFVASWFVGVNINYFVFLMVFGSIIGSLLLYRISALTPLLSFLFFRPQWIKWVK